MSSIFVRKSDNVVTNIVDSATPVSNGVQVTGANGTYIIGCMSELTEYDNVTVPAGMAVGNCTYTSSGGFVAYDPAYYSGISLTDAQTIKLAQVNDIYNQKLAAGFTSSASGSALTYGYAATDQMKFMQVSLEVLLSPSTAFPVTVHPKDGSSVSLAQAQYTQLVTDIAAFAKPLDTQQHTYISQVNACTTVDQVKAIAVSF